MTGIEDYRELGSDPRKRRDLLDQLTARDPRAVRQFIMRHPRNLMVFDGWNVEGFHNDALEDALRYDRILWLAPRGSGKSTAYLYACVWAALADPKVYTRFGIPYLFPDAPREIGPHNIRIALTTNSAEKAVSLMYQAREILLQKRLHRVFGKSLQGRRWKDYVSDTSLRTERLKDGTLNALGLKSKVTGGHFDIGLVDDWVTEDNAQTETQRGRIESFWNYTVSHTLEPWARVWGAGTRYHPYDFWNTIWKWAEERGTWKVRRTPAITVDSKGRECSYWPEVFPLEKLYERREEVGLVAFQAQYQNEVDLMKGNFFDSDWFENYKTWDEWGDADKRKARTVIALDPAIGGGPRNDFSVFTVLHYIKPWFHVRRVIRGQWTQLELEQRIAYLNRLFRPEVFGIEVVAGIEWLAQAVIKKQRSVPIHRCSPKQSRGRDKVGRANEVRKFFEQGRVFLETPDESNGIMRLKMEAMAFPQAKDQPGMDDCVDSLVWAMLLCKRQRGRLVKLPSRRGL